MGRKAKRKKRQRQQSKPIYNRHHLLYQRRKWSNGAAWLLRNHWYMIVELPVAVHNYIHRQIQTVPVASGAATSEIYRRLQALAEVGAITDNDSVEVRLAIIIPMFDELDPAVADALRQQQAILDEWG